MRATLLLLAAACGGSSKASPDAPAGASDGPAGDAVSADAPSGLLGSVTNVMTVTCPTGLPASATCRQITVTGCPGFASETIDATVAYLPQTGTLNGTIVHFSGGGGEGFEANGQAQYAQAGFQQAFVSWATDWEQTQSLGIKAAGCRPSTVLEWLWNDPTVHDASTAIAFCGQGFSGGSGQLGYALAHYGLYNRLDYVNELSGPPFARIDLGCDYSQPQTATVCGVADTMRLPTKVGGWENTPTTCGSTTPPAADVAKWNADSIAVGGTYVYPQTDVQFFDCTNMSTAVTAMAQIYYGELTAAAMGYHCYSQADGCSGEGLGTGTAAAVQSMIAGCTPRH